MDLYSLEDDGGEEMFITQTPRCNMLDNIEMSGNEENEQFLGVNVNDFQSPCSSLVNQGDGHRAIYEDISDDDGDFACNLQEANFE